jgi:hypothetical protein
MAESSRRTQLSQREQQLIILAVLRTRPLRRGLG